MLHVKVYLFIYIYVYVPGYVSSICKKCKGVMTNRVHIYDLPGGHLFTTVMMRSCYHLKLKPQYH